MAELEITYQGTGVGPRWGLAEVRRTGVGLQGHQGGAAPAADHVLWNININLHPMEEEVEAVVE